MTVDPGPYGETAEAPASTAAGEAGAGVQAGVELSPVAADLIGALDADQTDEEAGVGRMIAGEVARALALPATSARDASHRSRQSRWWRRS